MNQKKRKAKNEKYLTFIRSLPCAVRGISGDDVHAHHVDVIGRMGTRNDYYAIPLKAIIHVPGGNHITEGRLKYLLNEDIREIAIFYLSLYIDYIQGNYDLEMDRSTQFMTLRRKKEGII